jgi:predicted Zn-dependent protease
MSGRRAAIEIGLAVGGLLGGVLLLMWLAGRLASHLTDFVPTDVDRTLGQQAWTLTGVGRECASPGPERYVREVVAPLLAALGPTPFEFSFRVIDDEQVNAFALPGGFVTVNMGLLRSAETGGEVAAVLAHELQHVVRRHGTRRVLRQLGGTTALYLLFGGTDFAAPAAILTDLASTAYDRDEEREADRLGLELLRRAGLDPSAMARFFERLAESALTPPELLSTHPDPGNRAETAANAARGFKARLTLPAPSGLSCRRE